MDLSVTHRLQEFAANSGLTGLTDPTLEAIRAGQPGYSLERGRRFLAFQERINNELLTHRVITDNRYTAWFKRGEQSEAQLKAFVVQFSVFSNLFLLAQLTKMINADSLEGMRASKEILANEIGVTFRPTQPRAKPTREGKSDPEFVGTEGTVQGGTFRFEAGHFEWLIKVGEALGLKFNELGRRRFGTPSTLFFCDELVRLYGHEDYAISQAASYAVENWAAVGFWQELIEGFKRCNAKHATDIPLGFFTWHNRLEGQHARHTQEELEEYYFQHEVNEDDFIRYGTEMLDGVAAFWDGLEVQRLQLADRG
jgi:hypothetical protein